MLKAHSDGREGREITENKCFLRGNLVVLVKSWLAAFGHSRVEKQWKTGWRGKGQVTQLHPQSSLSF